MAKKTTNVDLIRSMKKGDVLEFPIKSLATMRNNVTTLNAQHYLEGKKWGSSLVKEKGIVEIERIN